VQLIVEAVFCLAISSFDWCCCTGIAVSPLSIGLTVVSCFVTVRPQCLLKAMPYWMPWQTPCIRLVWVFCRLRLWPPPSTTVGGLQGWTNIFLKGGNEKFSSANTFVFSTFTVIFCTYLFTFLIIEDVELLCRYASIKSVLI